jgi:hypothetical protein
LLILTFISTLNVFSCNCPPTTLSKSECEKYEIIFRGIVKSVKPCESLPGEAVFEVQELYKGNATPMFTVLFKCDDPCFANFVPGDEWIIYTRYKQIGNALMDWCSRSRKFFRHEKEDYYKVNYGTDYFDELRFLRENLGLHRLLVEQKNDAGNRNKLPDTSEKIMYLLISIGTIVLFYVLFRKFFK